MMCIKIGCKKEATWNLGGQWQLCDEHIDEAEKYLQDSVNSYIRRSPIS
jgi:hypothetical protein